MIKVALVSYFNTRPFIDGLQHWYGEDEVELLELPPSECAKALLDGRCELALLPVGSLVDFKGLTLMKDHCIGADGEVDSVFLFSEVPVAEVESMVLDDHSRTSNGLAAVLMKHYWEKEIRFVKQEGERFSQIKGKQCGVAIGDKAFAMRGEFPYVYDLAQIWKRFCGLPFVFAVWAYAEGGLDVPQRERLRAALEWGRINRSKSAIKWAERYHYTQEAALHYLSHSISYEFDSAKHEAMKLYSQLLQEVELP